MITQYVEPTGWGVVIVQRIHRVAGQYYIYLIILKCLHWADKTPWTFYSMEAPRDGRVTKYVEPTGWCVGIVWRIRRVAGQYHIYLIIVIYPHQFVKAPLTLLSYHKSLHAIITQNLDFQKKPQGCLQVFYVVVVLQFSMNLYIISC